MEGTSPVGCGWDALGIKTEPPHRPVDGHLPARALRGVLSAQAMSDSNRPAPLPWSLSTDESIAGQPAAPVDAPVPAAGVVPAEVVSAVVSPVVPAGVVPASAAVVVDSPATDVVAAAVVDDDFLSEPHAASNTPTASADATNTCAFLRDFNEFPSDRGADTALDVHTCSLAIV